MKIAAIVLMFALVSFATCGNVKVAQGGTHIYFYSGTEGCRLPLAIFKWIADNDQDGKVSVLVKGQAAEDVDFKNAPAKSPDVPQITDQCKIDVNLVDQDARARRALANRVVL